MIIYGSRTTHLTTDKVDEPCTNCGTSGSVYMNVYQRYAHVFWIPLFPVGKKAVSQCQHCKQALKTEEMPHSYRQAYKELKTGVRTPLWTFIGLVLIAGLVGMGVMSSKRQSERNAVYIGSPQKEDVYEVKLGEGQYTLYKVQEVTGDTVYLLLHQYETNKITGISDLKKKGDTGYSYDEVLAVTIPELKRMHEKGTIIDVERK